MLLDQPPRLGEGGAVVKEASAVEVDLGKVEGHRPALGDLLGFVEVGAGGVAVALDGAQPGAGEEAVREELDSTCAAESVDCLLDLGRRVLDRGPSKIAR